MASHLILLIFLFQHFLPFHSQFLDPFECINIHRQPAFSHPLLRHHKIRYLPNIPRFLEAENPRSTGNEGIVDLCPQGKVPIASNPLTRPLHDINSGVKYNAMISTSRSEATYHGGSAIMGAFNPPVNMAQSSRSSIWVQNGPTSVLNSIEAGWAVHPNLYGDNYTRLTTYWTADNFQSTGCYNLLCPGFVQINATLFLGQAYRADSKMWPLPFSILQDNVTGNWWLITKVVDFYTAVGYWPKEILTYLGLGADVVKYGGTTSTYLEQEDRPPMGSGKYPVNDYGSYPYQYGWFTRIRYVNESYNLIYADNKMVKVLDSVCYGLIYYNLIWFGNNASMMFGGPGGPANKCKNLPPYIHI